MPRSPLPLLCVVAWSGACGAPPAPSPTDTSPPADTAGTGSPRDTGPAPPAEVDAVYPYGAGPGVTVTVSGRGFGAAMGSVSVGGVSASVGSWGPDQIVFTMPEGVVGNIADVQLGIGGATVEAGSLFAWEPGVLQLTNTVGGTGASAPTWSADGRWIVFVMYDNAERQSDLYRVPATGGAPERILHTAANEQWPDVQPTSGAFAFGSDRTDNGNTGDYEIWIALPGFATIGPLDDGFVTQVDLDRAPAWSGQVEAGIDLAWEHREDVSWIGLRRDDVIEYVTTGVNPRFDPRDGRRLLIGDHVAQILYLFTYDIPTNTRTLIPTPQEPGGADWGVNGRIAYATTGGDIWATDPDGSDQEPLVATPSREYAPRWSPDADRLAFGSHRFGNFDVFVKVLPE